jgi:hypothetical protein
MPKPKSLLGIERETHPPFVHFPGDNEYWQIAGKKAHVLTLSSPCISLLGLAAFYSGLLMSDNSSGGTESKSEQEQNQSSLQQTSTDQSTSTPINSSTITDERSSQSSPLVTRDELLSRAREFLTSPHVQQQDVIAKRAFLSEKSLTGGEIDSLLHTSVCSKIVF